MTVMTDITILTFSHSEAHDMLLIYYIFLTSLKVAVDWDQCSHIWPHF